MEITTFWSWVPEKIISFIVLFVDFSFDLSMKFGEKRPVKTPLQVVGCMIPEITCQKIIPWFSDVIRRLIWITTIESTMMMIRGIYCSNYTCYHRNEKDQYSCQWSISNQNKKKSELYYTCIDKISLNVWEFLSHYPSANIGSATYDVGIYDWTISFPCCRLPGWLILKLILIMNMMSEIVVKYPCIRYYSCLESVHYFEKPIENRKRECRNMLVVMIPRTYESLHYNTEKNIYK